MLIAAFYFQKKNDSSINQSSLHFKEWIAEKYPEFQSTNFQDPSEFISCLISECQKLTQLTKCEIISSYQCNNCDEVTNDADHDERFRNIIYLKINGNSIAEIILNARTAKDTLLQRCLWCENMNHHEITQNWLILPSVLIISLHRHQDSEFVEVEPSLRLEIDGVFYGLRSVISHHASKSHITASLYNSNTNSWIKCDDKDISVNEKPKKGLVFIYDKIDDNEFLSTATTADEQSDQGTSSKDDVMSPTERHCKREKPNDVEDVCPKKCKTKDFSKSSLDPYKCKVCKKDCKSLSQHLKKQKKPPRCIDEYNSDELAALESFSKEKISESKQKHRNENIAKVAESKKQFHQKNPGKAANYSKKFKSNHPEYFADYLKENPEKAAEYSKTFKENHPEYFANYRENHSEKAAEYSKTFKEKHPEKPAEYRKEFKEKNPEKTAEGKKESYEKDKKDFEKQIKRFRLECIGPIFTCICCMRDLFRRSTDELKADIEHIIIHKNQMSGYLNFDESLKVHDEYEKLSKDDGKTKINKKVREGYSLCKTCVSYLKKSQVPPMCSKNSLEPAVIPDCLQNLSDVEKQLIVKNLIFIKVRALPKTRMAAMNDRVINVPITDENIAKRVNSLPRTEKISGMVNVGLKRKLNMKNFHKHGLINPVRVYEACQYLIENHPDYSNIKLLSYEDWSKDCPSLFNQTEHSDSEEEIEDSSDEEKVDKSDKNDTDKSDEKENKVKKGIEGEAADNDFNATTCLYPKEPATDMIVNHTNEKKNVKFRRKDKKVYEYAPGDDNCGVS